MKAHLLYRDRDFDLEAEPLPEEQDLIEDLGLQSLFAAMARGDKFLYEVARRAVLTSLADVSAIAYRQDVLEDCLQQRELIRELYDLVVEALDARRKAYYWFIASDSPSAILHRSVSVLGLLVDYMAKLHEMGAEHADKFRSDGFSTFFAMIAAELDEEYLQEVREHLRRLAFDHDSAPDLFKSPLRVRERLRRLTLAHGVLMSARLKRGNKGTGYVLRKPNEPEPGLRSQMAALTRRSGYSFRIADRDEAGFRALEELRSKGLNDVANAMAQSVDHILSFFAMLRVEVGFYVGALNAQERLAELGEPTCRPVPTDGASPTLNARDLYDVGLSLRGEQRVVGNDIDAEERPLIVVTGANQGGKSTFLRSVGLAQLMMQAGMFVAAESFGADVRDRLFTHFKREEDTTMTSGKFDEELARMRTIVDQLTPGSLVLCNESFAATNEREGSEIALQVLRALLDSGVKVILVTHMYDLASRLRDADGERALFLRAEREADGSRSFHLHHGEPLPTSYGIDVYRRIFGEPEAAPGKRDSTALAR